ncbi:MAG: hypothetical protein P8Z42_02135 [Anaerolineales bacterium]|jgi:hypothetical protein
MSMHDVQTIIIRAVMDSDYRELFFNDRSRALEGYNLASIETMWLQRLARKEFDAFAPEVRSSLKQGGGIAPSPQRI